jgi:fumarylacetoacetase
VPGTNATHDAARRSWISSANDGTTDFPIQNLPLGIFRVRGEDPGSWRAGVAIGDQVFDLRAGLAAGLFDGTPAEAAARAAASGPTLNALMALGNDAASALRARLSDLLRIGGDPAGEKAAARILVPMDRVELGLPTQIGAFTDFLTSIHHTGRGGRITRPDNPVPAAFKHLPIAYNSRASTVRASGHELHRPNCQRRRPDGQVTFGPCEALDYELEVGIFVGPGNAMGQPIGLHDAPRHIFGYCLVNDWSARDIQRWESHLGPFLGKSAATTISPWVVTAEALAPFRAPAPPRPEGDPRPLPYLFDPADQAEGGLDLGLEAWIETPATRRAGSGPLRLTRSNFLHMYWTFGQMLTHHASNGCELQPGDLIASGTASGPTDESRACMNELNIDVAAGQRRPFPLGNGEERLWLEDGDEITFRARAERPGFVPIGFGECRGRVAPAPAWPTPR